MASPNRYQIAKPTRPVVGCHTSECSSNHGSSPQPVRQSTVENTSAVAGCPSIVVTPGFEPSSTSGASVAGVATVNPQARATLRSVCAGTSSGIGHASASMSHVPLTNFRNGAVRSLRSP